MQVKCKECKHVLNEELAFCLNCGHDLIDFRQLKPKTKIHIKKSVKIIVIGMILIPVLSLVTMLTRNYIFEGPERVVDAYYQSIHENDVKNVLKLSDREDKLLSTAADEDLRELFNEINHYYSDTYREDWHEHLSFNTIDKTKDEAKIEVVLKKSDKIIESFIGKMEDLEPIGLIRVVKKEGKWLVVFSSL